MRLYWEVARQSFRRHTTYRTATAAGAFTNTAFGFMKAYVLIALWHARPHLGGYDITDAVTFCFLSQALLTPVAIFGYGLDLPERIRTGDVATDLYRPADFQSWWLANDLGRALFDLIFRGLPPILLGALAFHLRLPTAGKIWLLFTISIALAVAVSFGLRYLTGLAVFWLMDDRGIRYMTAGLATFLSGLTLPLILFPGWLGMVARDSPWAMLIQIPADIFLGKSQGSSLIGDLALQAAWAIVLLGLGRYVTTVARRRVVVQGG